MQLIEALSGMGDSLFARITDRLVANVRLIRGAPEAIAITLLVAVGIFYFALQHFESERLLELNDRIASQERLLTDYQTKLRGATPEEAAAQIEKLTGLLADAQKSLSVAKSKPASVENRSRDSRWLYEDNKPIALVHDPKIDLDKNKVTFPMVSAEAIMGVNRFYEFQDWKLACGGTQLYSTVNVGSGHEYSYSPLTCKILGNR
jgi:hypothetical protein